jgi:hypothetical protein
MRTALPLCIVVMKMNKIVALMICVVLVSCPQPEPDGSERVRSLHLYASFQEPKVIIYGRHAELLTLAKVLATEDTIDILYSPSFYSTEDRWFITKNNKWDTYYRHEDGKGFVEIPPSEYENTFIELQHSEILVNEDGVHFIEFSWSKPLILHFTAIDGDDTITEFIHYPLFTSELFFSKELTFSWRFSAEEGLLSRQISRTQHLGLHFKEVSRDEHGITFRMHESDPGAAPWR